jgi:predicted PurR-regulated permease PerM
MENNNETLDYLKQIRDLNKKRLMWSRVTALLMALFVVLVACVIPAVLNTLKVAEDTMLTANDTLEQAQYIMTDMTSTIDTMETTLESVTKLVNDSSESLVAALDNINSIDFEGLNKAIEDLGNVVEPLSNFFKKFR